MNNPLHRSTRIRKQQGSSNAARQDGEPGDKSMDLTPASISRRRRRVIESDDEELEVVVMMGR